jgi:hypothetical protein
LAQPDISFTPENYEAQLLKGATMNTDIKPITHPQPDSETIDDTDLSLKPSREREQLLDAERRDEMNDHDEARVDGKHYQNAEQAVAVKESELNTPSGEHPGTQAEEMDRTQGSPATGTKPAEGKGERSAGSS